ncbi:putative DNA-binding transcriptional regulator [Raoultella terrigena]|uniref:Putative DNA-binding transcriptional regulator n=1 Tax=Raoultella terrigena TaxID=577 RepID=A0A3P8KQH0_RAOTE|nr:putative DNA-binding transcriptional regulator [Raoultella terrigena]
MRLNLDVLQILDALETHGSFATAAESLYKTPAALSYMIQKLGKRSRYHPAGSQRTPGEVYRYRHNGAGKGSAAAQCGKGSGKAGAAAECRLGADLAIALDASFPFDRLLPLIDAFYTQNPQTRLNFTHHTLAGAWEELTRNGADIILGAINEPPTSAEWSWKMLGTLDNVFVVAPGHPLAERHSR